MSDYINMDDFWEDYQKKTAPSAKPPVNHLKEIKAGQKAVLFDILSKALASIGEPVQFTKSQFLTFALSGSALLPPLTPYHWENDAREQLSSLGLDDFDIVIDYRDVPTKDPRKGINSIHYAAITRLPTLTVVDKSKKDSLFRTLKRELALDSDSAEQICAVVGNWLGGRSDINLDF